MKRILCASILSIGTLIVPSAVNASILSYGGYTHDTSTDIVAGNGLEWLQWDRTNGQSIDSVQSLLGTIEGGGWSIATNSHMAQLFNAFNFGSLIFDSDESTSQYIQTGISSTDPGTEADELFVAMFSATTIVTSGSLCYQNTNCYHASRAIFGDDLNANGAYNAVDVYDDYTIASGRPLNVRSSQGQVGLLMEHAYYSSDRMRDGFGIALIRSTTSQAIPTPSTLSLMGFVLAMAVFRRKSKDRVILKKS